MASPYASLSLSLYRPNAPSISARPPRSQLLQVKPRQQPTSYRRGPLDAFLLHLFRSKMVQEVGWDSPKPGYDGLIEISRRLLSKNKDRADTEAATVRILRSLFPPMLLPLFKALVAPLFGGKPAAVLTARVTQATCQWLMGNCVVNTIDLADGSSLESGVLVERCKYLEESKCAGICIHTCKLPTQTFMKESMGISLAMEPNFQDLSCQFKFGVEALPANDDETLQIPCLEICPTAAAQLKLGGVSEVEQCPKVF